MHWLDEQEFERRPLVLVEDHLYHTSDLLAALHEARPDLLGRITAVGVDRAGPDTDAIVGDWLDRYPALQVVANVGRSFRAGNVGRSFRAGNEGRSFRAGDIHRLRSLEADDLAALPRFARLVAQLLRPGGVLVQDIQLSTLAFVPADRWWESIYAAATVRGLFPDRPPIVRFLSNKRGYAATFGRELLEAGFDPRDVMDKADLATVVVPAVLDLIRRTCPLTLVTTVGAPGESSRSVIVGDDDAERRGIEATLDLLLWPTPNGTTLGGRWVAAAGGRVALRTGSPEEATWAALIEDRLAGGPGLRVVDVGARIAPPDAGRAEITNLAARHLHTLRSRLHDGGAIVTAQHAYRLREGARVGRVPPATFATDAVATKVAE